MKRKSNPNKYCSCGGICYQGKFLDKYILVCSKCRKCQYDIRNGRYKYKLYLFQRSKKKEEEEKTKKEIKPIKNRNQNNKYKGLKISSESNTLKENQNYLKIKYNNNAFKEINSEKNKVPIIPKVIINFSNFSKSKKK